MQCSRGLLVSLILLFLAASLSCRREKSGPAIGKDDIRISVGLAGVIAPECWNSVRLEVKNRGEDFHGTLEVSLGSENETEPVTYRMPLEIPGGERAVKEAEFPIRFGEAARAGGWNEVHIDLRSSGFATRFRRELPLTDESPLRILVAGEESIDLSALGREVETALNPEGKSAKERLVSTNGLRPVDLPRSPLAYDPFGLVVLWGTALQGADPEALVALRGWVESGGTLVAFPGPEWAGGMGAGFLDLLGVTAGDPSAPLPAPLSDSLASVAEGGIYRELLPAAGTRALAGGLAFGKWLGAGEVQTFTFRPGGRRFPTRAESPALHDALRPVLVRAITFSGRAADCAHRIESTAAGALFELCGFQFPDQAEVYLASFVYLGFGFILPWAYFRRRRRREWVFAVILLMAGLSTWLIYRQGLLSSLRGQELEEISILRVHAGGTEAEATSFVGVISPSAATVDLGAPPGWSPGPLRGFLQQGFQSRKLVSPETEIEITPERKSGLGPVKVYPHSMRYFRFDGRASLEGLVGWRTEEPVDQKAGHLWIKNSGPGPLHLALVEGKKFSRLPNLKPGEEARVDAEENLAWDEFALPIESLDFAGSTPSQVLQSIQRRLLHRLAGGPRGGEPALPFPVQVGGSFQVMNGSTQGNEDGASGKDLPEEWNRHQPRYLVALSENPVFPGGTGIATRHAITAIVRELPPAGGR